MSGELYGLSGPGQRFYQQPPQRPGGDLGQSLNLAQSIAQQIAQALLGGGIFDLGDDPLGAAANLLGLRWLQMDDFEDGQLALRDRLDLLSQLEDTGSSYADGQNAIVNLGKVPFDRPLGPQKGCQLVNGGWVLGDQGRWDIYARMAFSFTIGPGGIGWQIRVYAPNGTLFSYQVDSYTDAASNTSGMHTSVVVPGPGYRVEVWITTLVAGRATIGGSQNTRLTVNHITRDISNLG